jgi:hypothetical protein
LRIFGGFRRFEGLVEDSLFFAGVFEAGEYRGGGRRVELADGLAFAIAGVNQAHEGGVEAGLHFERLETGIAEQALLGVDEALDDADFEAVGGRRARPG